MVSANHASSNSAKVDKVTWSPWRDHSAGVSNADAIRQRMKKHTLYSFQLHRCSIPVLVLSLACSFI